jgi:hypothetical protein
VDEVTIFVDKISPQIVDNSELWQAIDLYSIKAQESVKNALVETNGQMIGMKRRLDEINKFSNEMTEKFKK